MIGGDFFRCKILCLKISPPVNGKTTTIHNEDVMNEQITKKLKDAGVSDGAIAVLEQEGYDTEACLCEVSTDELKDAGVKKGGDRSKIKVCYPKSEPQPTTETANNDDKFTSAIERLVQKDRDCCPNCHEPLPKGFNDEMCPHCGLPVNEQVNCLSCGKPNNSGNAYCTSCAGRILSGEAYRQVKYLLDVDEMSFRQAVLMLEQIKQDEKELRRFQMQVSKWIDKGGLAQSQSVTRRGGVQGTETRSGFHLSIRGERS